METSVKHPSLPSVKRMPMYLRIIQNLSTTEEQVSATQIARELGIEPIVTRKDLELLGILGKPGVGYNIKELIPAIENFLGWDNASDAVLVGAGSLGTALLGYQGFANYGMHITAVFDQDPKKVGREIHKKKIFPLEKLANLISRMHISIAIIAVPKECAQETADKLVAAGIKAIWNFAPIKISAPTHVIVQNEDLAEGLAVLFSKLKREQSRSAKRAG